MDNPQFIEDSKQIAFDEASHKYTFNGQTLISVTTFISEFSNVFDEDGSILAKCALEQKVSKKELQKQWHDKRDKAAKTGTLWHETIEDYIKNGKIRKNKFFNITKQFVENYKFKGKLFSEIILSLPDIGISGTTDLLQLLDDNTIQIHDFKCTEKKPSDFNFGKQMKPPIQHLGDSKITKFSLQISLYAYILSSRYGYNIGTNNNIFWIDLKGKKIERIPIQLRIKEVQDMIASYCYNKSLAENVVS